MRQPAEFEFVHAVDGLTLHQGFVLCREDEMILDIEEPDNGRWNIRGKAKNGFFEGRHEGPAGDVSARAKWIHLDEWSCRKCRRLCVTRIRPFETAKSKTSASGTDRLAFPASIDVRTSWPRRRSSITTCSAMFSFE